LRSLREALDEAITAEASATIPARTGLSTTLRAGSNR
jgi:hypothetical protein